MLCVIRKKGQNRDSLGHTTRLQSATVKCFRSITDVQIYVSLAAIVSCKVTGSKCSLPRVVPHSLQISSIVFFDRARSRELHSLYTRGHNIFTSCYYCVTSLFYLFYCIINRLHNDLLTPCYSYDHREVAHVHFNPLLLCSAICFSMAKWLCFRASVTTIFPY